MFDTSLLEKLKQDNSAVFNDLFRYYYPRLKAYLAAMVEEEVAEDIVQDVFLYVWENRKRLYMGDGFHSYLFQSAYTRSLDYFKKQQSRGGCMSDIDSGLMKEYHNLLEMNVSALDNLYTEDFYRQLYNLLDQLPDQRREVFVLSYIKGMKAKEVAEQTQIPQRTVESHLYLALRFLKDRMSKKDFYLLCVFISMERFSC